MNAKRIHLDAFDFTQDARAAVYVKAETVEVRFAREAGELMSLEGANTYAPGDALIRAAGGEQWVVAAERFVGRYEALPPATWGEDGLYRNIPSTVWAIRMEQPFSMARRAGGDVLTGEPGDWIVQYAPGDFGVVRQDRFKRVYALRPHA